MNKAVVWILGFLTSFFISVAPIIIPAQAHEIRNADSCLTFGIAETYITHEWGHDIASVAVGENPMRPFALWGDKWGEQQKDFRKIALGGFVSQFWRTAVEIGLNSNSGQCAADGNRIMTYFYTAKLSLTPRGGDYDIFSEVDKNKIAFINVGGAFVLKSLSESFNNDQRWLKKHNSFFEFSY